jgi:hypothetical protein
MKVIPAYLMKVIPVYLMKVIPAYLMKVIRGIATNQSLTLAIVIVDSVVHGC